MNDKLEKYLQKALKFISIRPRSQKEILDYLKRKIPRNLKLRNLVLKNLERLDLVDDQAFVLWWLDQRNTFRPKGKRALLQELRQKGIERELVENSLADLDELPLARRVALKKTKILDKLPYLERKQKLSAFLARRGFGWSIISKILDEMIEKE